MIIYEVLQHYYDEQRSRESWSSLLMSLLAETKQQRKCALRQSVEKHNKRLFQKTENSTHV